jgi:hypothetical protein
MKKNSLKKENIDTYVKRETIKKMKIVSILLFGFLLLMFAITSSYGVDKIIMFPLSLFFILILGIIYASTLSQIKEITELTVFVFSEESVSKTLDVEKLGLMNKIGLLRNEFRYGIRLNQTIKFSDIESTSINENEITITSIDYDFFTSNGEISIRKEIENYEAIKSEIINNSDKYKILN